MSSFNGNADFASISHGKEGFGQKGRVLRFPVDPCSYTHLWLRAVGIDQENEIKATRGRNEFPPQDVWALRDMV